MTEIAERITTAGGAYSKAIFVDADRPVCRRGQAQAGYPNKGCV
ncbi:hypothetical protein [Mycobacterium lepromatosis]|nr:hypothetical protein [Mycobacterium lepromatosis]